MNARYSLFYYMPVLFISLMVSVEKETTAQPLTFSKVNYDSSAYLITRYGVTTGNDNSYFISGEFLNGDGAMLCKTDSAGHFLWSKR